MLRYETITAQAAADHVQDIAQLRITVFAQWPYLYDGDLDYERWYLGQLAKTDGAVIVLAKQADTIVGVSTAMPLAGEHDAFQAAMRQVGHTPSDWFYLAESVLLPACRGYGAGHVFFDERERHARALGFEKTCFCSVLRPINHPLMDRSVRPLDGFWRRRGYQPIEGAMARFSWKDRGQSDESEKCLQMWARDTLT